MVRLRSPAPILRQSFGGIPERPKGADCKSVVTDFAGPNPASPTNKKGHQTVSFFVGQESIIGQPPCAGQGSASFFSREGESARQGAVGKSLAKRESCIANPNETPRGDNNKKSAYAEHRRFLILFGIFAAFHFVNKLHYEISLEALDGVHLAVIRLFGLDLIEIKNGNKDKSRKTCVEASVIENEASVHSRR